MTVPVKEKNDTFILRNGATNRCLMPTPWSGVVVRPPQDGPPFTVALVPCNDSDTLQQWHFDMGASTVTNVVNAKIGKALAVSNETLYSQVHATKDAFAVSDAAYGYSGLVLVDPYDQPGCSGRGCQNYDPSQMWFYSPHDRMLRQATFTRSINHRDAGGKFELTPKMPTWRHHCLAHTLAIGEAWHVTGSQWPITGAGTVNGTTEVWGGPLQLGAFVLALVNRGESAANITAHFSLLEVDGIDADSIFEVESLWDDHSFGALRGSLTLEVPRHDAALLRLSAPRTTYPIYA